MIAGGLSYIAHIFSINLKRVHLPKLKVMMLRRLVDDLLLKDDIFTLIHQHGPVQLTEFDISIFVE
jgi:hypothetical protein